MHDFTTLIGWHFRKKRQTTRRQERIIAWFLKAYPALPDGFWEKFEVSEE